MSNSWVAPYESTLLPCEKPFIEFLATRDTFRDFQKPFSNTASTLVCMWMTQEMQGCFVLLGATVVHWKDSWDKVAEVVIESNVTSDPSKPSAEVQFDSIWSVVVSTWDMVRWWSAKGDQLILKKILVQSKLLLYQKLPDVQKMTSILNCWIQDLSILLHVVFRSQLGLE